MKRIPRLLLLLCFFGFVTSAPVSIYSGYPRTAFATAEIAQVDIASKPGPNLAPWQHRDEAASNPAPWHHNNGASLAGRNAQVNAKADW
jgi:hypothetical protein